MLLSSRSSPISRGGCAGLCLVFLISVYVPLVFGFQIIELLEVSDLFLSFIRINVSVCLSLVFDRIPENKIEFMEVSLSFLILQMIVSFSELESTIIFFQGNLI